MAFCIYINFIDFKFNQNSIQFHPPTGCRCVHLIYSNKVNMILIPFIFLFHFRKLVGLVLGVGLHHSNLSGCKNTASPRRTIYWTIELQAIVYELYAGGICDLWHCFRFAHNHKRDVHFYYRNRCAENQRSRGAIHIEPGFETVSANTYIIYTNQSQSQ